MRPWRRAAEEKDENGASGCGRRMMRGTRRTSRRNKSTMPRPNKTQRRTTHMITTGWRAVPAGPPFRIRVGLFDVSISISMSFATASREPSMSSPQHGGIQGAAYTRLCSLAPYTFARACPCPCPVPEGTRRPRACAQELEGRGRARAQVEEAGARDQNEEPRRLWSDAHKP